MKHYALSVTALFLALCFFPLPAAGQAEDLTVYVTNTGGKYHLEACKSLSRSKIPLPLGDAARSGYEACAICKPPVLGSAALSPINTSNTSNTSANTPINNSERNGTGLYRLNNPGLASVNQADLSRMIRAEVVGHVDGDTLRVRINNPPPQLNAVEIIRMIGVDTPETVHPRREVEYFGKEASEFTRRLLGEPVLLAFDWDLRDRYGRLLTYIYTPGGTCHNAALIREGYAHAYTRHSFQFLDEFRRLEQQARQTNQGLWQ
jgi:micrococcal nuclease